MRRINFEDYDAIVFSWGSLYLTYPLPFIKYGSPKTEPNHRQRMFRELFNKGFSRQRIEQIKSERAKLDQELEFYKKTPDSMPAKLRMQLQASIDSEQAAYKYIANQRQELVAMHKRYDAEQALLQTLWK